MPHKSKRACQAEAQHASGTWFFDAGFTDNIDEYIGDPNYSPDIEGVNEGWAFSFFEGEVLRSTVRSNVKPKCGNKSFWTLLVFLYPIGYGLLFWVSAKFRYNLRTRWRSKINALV